MVDLTARQHKKESRGSWDVPDHTSEQVFTSAPTEKVLLIDGQFICVCVNGLEDSWWIGQRDYCLMLFQDILGSGIVCERVAYKLAIFVRVDRLLLKSMFDKLWMFYNIPCLTLCIRRCWLRMQGDNNLCLWKTYSGVSVCYDMLSHQKSCSDEWWSRRLLRLQVSKCNRHRSRISRHSYRRKGGCCGRYHGWPWSGSSSCRSPCCAA